ncbi:hypothetical protein Q3G72_003102 [Acer saccharum]|nr:hypothetical protein Q3G72_003102 [Acer saccharum]
MFAKELLSIPDDEWSEWGGNFEKPDGEGTSKSVVDGGDCEFRVYFKGLVSQESVNGKTVEFSGIGVATSGPMDNVIFELKKPLIGDRMNKNAVEIKALIEGLNAALSLELKHVQFLTDYFPLYQFVNYREVRWPPKQRKIAVLVNQLQKIGFCWWWSGGSGTRKCVKCQGLFCINCKVPWDKDMTCFEYKRLNPNPPTEDVKLKSLASMNLWHMMALLLMNIHGIQFSMLTQLWLRLKELNNIRAVGKDENVKLSYNGDIQYQLFEKGEVAGKGNFWLAVN